MVSYEASWCSARSGGAWAGYAWLTNILDPEEMIVSSGIVEPSLLVIAGFLDGSGRLALWGAALAIDYLGVLLGDVSAWRISPDHFVERNGLRIGGGLGRGRPIATVLLLGLLPVAREAPALVTLGLVAAVCASLIGYEALRHREARAFIRSRRGAFTREEAQRVEPGPRRHRG